MTFDEAKEFLSRYYRDELRDHAFGDREIYWRTAEDEEVAFGYLGNGDYAVSIIQPDSANSRFIGTEALALAKCGLIGRIDRNDETGPDEYQDGQIMPGLTLEGVRAELED